MFDYQTAILRLSCARYRELEQWLKANFKHSDYRMCSSQKHNTQWLVIVQFRKQSDLNLMELAFVE